MNEVTQPIPAAITLDGVCVRYRDQEIVGGIGFEIPRRCVTSIVGPSGVGKSTILRTLNRLLEEEEGFTREGRILFNGTDISAPHVDKTILRRKIGIIFQKPVVFPISIFKNVIFGVHYLKLSHKRNYHAIVEEFLMKVSLWDEVKDRLHRSALELSVGQQQRLTIARTLALDPEVILMDEPTSSLDVLSTEKIEELISKLKAEHTVVLVTHHLEQAFLLSDKIVCLLPEAGKGCVFFQGTPAELEALGKRTTLPRFFRLAFPQ